MKVLMVVLFTGVVDRIVGNLVAAEVDDSEEVVLMPVSAFPCAIQEGESFYLVRYDGEEEIVCGEPPE
tara:strand:- start:286 stop:489 length:204 start_codon:yes stop_codon:yes gene_type:complete